MYYTRIFLFVKFSGHGESWGWLSIGDWREVRGEAPGWRALIRGSGFLLAHGWLR